MAKVTLLPADTYIVINKTILHNSDRNILIMLYQPIIGSNAISLYNTLWSYLDKLEIMSSEWTHHHLMGSLKLRLEEIIEAKELLEGIGLIKTYYKESNNLSNFIYELYSPMSAYEFLTNPILATSLHNNIGDLEYQRTIKYFKNCNIDLSQYKDITSSFIETFEPLNQIQYDIICEDIRKSSKTKLEITSKIDMNELLSRFNNELLDIKKINKEMKDLIYKLSFIYNLSNDDLEKIILDSINGREIDKELLRSSSRKYYQFENSGKLPTIVYKNQPEDLRKKITDTTNKTKLIHQFETTSPYEFLHSKLNGGKPSKYDLSILEYLLLDLKLSPGVVNVLLDFVLKINNNKLSKPYIEAISGTWKRSNIKTVEEAMDFALKERTTKRKVQNKKIETKPKWFDEKIEVNPLTDEEKQEMEDLLKEFK